jgi:hypothetical protein
MYIDSVQLPANLCHFLLFVQHSGLRPAHITWPSSQRRPSASCIWPAECSVVSVVCTVKLGALYKLPMEKSKLASNSISIRPVEMSSTPCTASYYGAAHKFSQQQPSCRHQRSQCHGSNSRSTACVKRLALNHRQMTG